jgi:hypothetical protein
MAACIRIATFACLLLAGAAQAQSSEVYQWKDAQGVTHYSDAPPPKGQYAARDIRHRDGEAAAATGTAADKPTTAASANCTLARTNLERLKAGGDIGLDANGDGKPDATLGAEERERQTRLAETNIKTFCTPGAAPTP